MPDAPGSYSDAVASFQMAERLKPSLYVPNLFVGIDYLHLNRTREAIPFLLKAETLNSSDPQAPIALDGLIFLRATSMVRAVLINARWRWPSFRNVEDFAYATQLHSLKVLHQTPYAHVASVSPEQTRSRPA